MICEQENKLLLIKINCIFNNSFVSPVSQLSQYTLCDSIEKKKKITSQKMFEIKKRYIMLSWITTSIDLNHSRTEMAIVKILF